MQTCRKQATEIQNDFIARNNAELVIQVIDEESMERLLILQAYKWKKLMNLAASYESHKLCQGVVDESLDKLNNNITRNWSPL